MECSLFVQDPKYRQRNFSTCDQDRPLIAQFCGDDPKILGQAAEIIACNVNAVDINFGCPQVKNVASPAALGSTIYRGSAVKNFLFFLQNIAKRGHYGAYLLEDPDLVE